MERQPLKIGRFIHFFRKPNSLKAQEFIDNRPGDYQHLCGFGLITEVTESEIDGKPVFFYEVKPVGSRFNRYYEMLRAEDMQNREDGKDTLIVLEGEVGAEVGVQAVSMSLAKSICEERLVGLFRSQHPDPAETNFRREKFEFLRDLRKNVAEAIEKTVKEASLKVLGGSE